MTKRFFVGATGALTLIVVLFQMIWAVSMPGFRGPDEPHHVNSIMRVASGGGWPAPGEAKVDSAIIDAGKEAGIITSRAVDFVGLSRTRLANDRLPEVTQAPFPTRFRNVQVTAHEDRSVIGSVQRLDPDSTEIDQMSQHPIPYYAGGAFVVDTFNLDEQPWDRLLLGLRIYGILLTIPVVPSLVYTARKLGSRRTWALAAGFLPFAVPQYFAITGAVTNDTLAIGLGALTVAALVKAGTERISWKTILFVGGSIGLALWTKGLLLTLGLALILVFALKKDESWKKRIIAIGVSGAMALAVGWWWIHNIIRYGVVQPSGFQRTVPEDWDSSSADFFHFLTQAIKSITTSFFSSFGWLEADFFWPLTLVLTLTFIGGVIWAIKSAGEHRRTFLALLAPGIGLILLLFAESWSTYTTYGTIAGVQGRYLFPMMAALAGIVLGLQKLRGKSLMLLTGAAMGVGSYGFIFLLNSAYPGYPWIDFSRYTLVAGFGEVTMTLFMELTVVLILAAFALAIVIAVEESNLELPATATIEEGATSEPGTKRRLRTRAKAISKAKAASKTSKESGLVSDETPAVEPHDGAEVPVEPATNVSSNQ
ncbi:MAG: DUF2142 domain-containing protein [Flaviflexus sp.]|uniref:DUF2142 domain-containing protein n=1 Tax=Flaviflexus sp. TaxID=1969482 RepID=UPI00352DC23A